MPVDIAFRSLTEGITDLRDKQATRQTFFMSAKVPVPNGGSMKMYFVPDMDADFAITGLTGSVVAPSDAAGNRYAPNLAHTLWPLNGAAPVNGYAERGLILQIYDAQNGLRLSDPSPDKWEVNLPFNPLVNVKDFLQPGYRLGAFTQPQKFCYYLRRTNKLVFEFFNRDTTVQHGRLVYHTVAITLCGRKVMMETK